MGIKSSKPNTQSNGSVLDSSTQYKSCCIPCNFFISKTRNQIRPTDRNQIDVIDKNNPKIDVMKATKGSQDLQEPSL